MQVLTDFQTLCEKRLVCELRRVGKRLFNRTVEHDYHTYVHANIYGTDAEVWIYEDEAEFSNGDINVIWENPEFDNTEDLICDFISRVLAEI